MLADLDKTTHVFFLCEEDMSIKRVTVDTWVWNLCAMMLLETSTFQTQEPLIDWMSLDIPELSYCLRRLTDLAQLASEEHVLSLLSCLSLQFNVIMRSRTFVRWLFLQTWTRPQSSLHNMLWLEPVTQEELFCVPALFCIIFHLQISALCTHTHLQLI